MSRAMRVFLWGFAMMVLAFGPAIALAYLTHIVVGLWWFILSIVGGVLVLNEVVNERRAPPGRAW